LRAIVVSAFVLCLAEAVLAQSPPAGQPVSWYAATVAEAEKGGFLMVHFWSKGPLFRSEAVVAGRKIVTIVDRTTYYILDEVSGQGIGIERSEAARALNDQARRPFGNELDKLLREGGELIGSEQSGGQLVDVYRLTDDRGRRTIWVSTTKPSIPLRVVTYDRSSATTGKLDYVNWLHNPVLADSFFAPDPRIEMKRFTYEEYRKQIRKAPLGPAPVLYRHLLHGEG
jgi:outer membrane lipoprotein-sorting protein